MIYLRRSAKVLLLLCTIVTALRLGYLDAADNQASTFARGEVFAATGNGEIKRFTPDGALLQTLESGAGGQNAGMTFDKQGNLYLAHFEADQVYRFAPDGALLGTFGRGFNAHPESLVFDAAQNLYVGQADGSRQVLEFDSQGNLVATISLPTEGRGSDWIDLAADQKTLFYTSEGAAVKRYDLENQRSLADFNQAPLPGSVAYALRVLPDGGVLVADMDLLVRLDRDGKQVQTYDADGEDNWFAVNLDPDGKTFWSGNLGTGRVYRFEMNSGRQVSTWDAGAVGALGGLAVYGEITAALTLPAIPGWLPYLLGLIPLGAGLAWLLRRRPRPVRTSAPPRVGGAPPVHRPEPPPRPRPPRGKTITPD